MDKNDYKTNRKENEQAFVSLDSSIRSSISRINEFLASQRTAASIRNLKPAELNLLTGLRHQLNNLTNYIGKADPNSIEENVLSTDSILSGKTKRGYVQISHGITFDVQVSPNEARAFAISILEAAEAAETDEFFYNFLTETIGVKDERKAAAVLSDFRAKRAERWENQNEEKSE